MKNGTAVDILDRENDILYCSIDCFLKSGADIRDYEIVDQETFDTRHDSNVETGNHWGAVCDCGNEYNNF